MSIHNACTQYGLECAKTSAFVYGIGSSIVGYFLLSTTTDTKDKKEKFKSGMLGAAIGLIGGAVFGALQGYSQGYQRMREVNYSSTADHIGSSVVDFIGTCGKYLSL
jgi:hypothetical protein